MLRHKDSREIVCRHKRYASHLISKDRVVK